MADKYGSPTTTKKKADSGTYRKANIALGLSALGLVAAYPFQSAFWGGLLTSGCSAALVGGLADWFAVNALFRRPLGVPAGKVFRTDIIPRNRARIFEALSSMVENELLSQEALKNKVEAYDFAVPARDIWNDLDRTSFQGILTQSFQQFQNSLSQREKDLNKETIAFWEQESLREEHAIPLMKTAFFLYLESHEGKKAGAALLQILSHWVQDTEVHLILTQWLEKAIQRYISQNPSRKILALFLPEPYQLAHNLQTQFAEYLLEDQTNIEVLGWLSHRVRRLPPGSVDISAEDVETPLAEDLFGTLLLKIYSKLIEGLTADLMPKLQDPKSALALSDWLLQGIDEGVHKLGESAETRQNFNRYVQGLLIPILENKHQKIGEIVQEGLQKYSNEMLVDLIESKVGDDLQMIRINGSVVGGLAGMLIFLVSQIIVF